MSRLRPTQMGFTLIEIALVLVVVGLLLGMLTQPVQTLLENQKRAETTQLLNEAKEALFGYAAQNGFLPRPAVSATDGRQRASCGASDCHGFLPWSELGVRGLDGFGKRIRYLVHPAYTAPNTISYSNPGTLSVQTTPGAAGSEINQLAFILISTAKRNGGVDQFGASHGTNCTPNADEVQNQTANNTEPIYAHAVQDETQLAGGCFDDIVVWAANTILYARLATAGRNLN